MTRHNVFRTVLLLSTLFALSITACQKSNDVNPGKVIYSPWTEVTFSGSGTSYTTNLNAPELTQDMLDKADIRVYWSTSNHVIGLPYAQAIGGTSYSVHQRFHVGRIELISSYSLSAQKMRYVIISGGAATGGRKAAVNLNDYAAVKACYNLPD